MRLLATLAICATPAKMRSTLCDFCDYSLAGSLISSIQELCTQGLVSPIIVPVPIPIPLIVVTPFPSPSPSLSSSSSSSLSLSLSPLRACYLFPPHPFTPHVLVPHSLLVPSPLTSLFPVPSSSAASTCDPPHEQWLARLGAGAGLFPIVVSQSWSHPTTHCPVIHPMSSSSQQWPGWAPGCHLGAVSL